MHEKATTLLKAFTPDCLQDHKASLSSVFCFVDGIVN